MCGSEENGLLLRTGLPSKQKPHSQPSEKENRTTGKPRETIGLLCATDFCFLSLWTAYGVTIPILLT